MACNDCDKNNIIKTIFQIGGDGEKTHYVNGDGEFIFVDRVETANDITDTISYSPYVPLTINSFTDDVALLLKGFTLTSFNLAWTYNKGVETHSLNQGLTAPTVVPAQTTYNLAVTGQSITSDTTITLTADDDTGDANAAKTANTSILFGNNIYHGAVTVADTGSYNPSEVNIKALTNSPIVRNKNGVGTVVYANSGTNVYEVFAAPTSFGITNFQDSGNPLPGGFVQVKTLNITNSEAFTEEYTVWRSSFDDSAGTDSFGNPFSFTVI